MATASIMITLYAKVCNRRNLKNVTMMNTDDSADSRDSENWAIIVVIVIEIWFRPGEGQWEGRVSIIITRYSLPDTISPVVWTLLLLLLLGL